MRGKVRYSELTDFEKKKFLGEFYSMISLLRSREEVKGFLKDLLTLSEVVMISRRIQIAKLLLKGKTYEDIMKNLKVSAATISQVEKWVNNGFGGYKKIIKRHGKKQLQKKDYSSKVITPFTLNHIRKKYPLHFLLFNLLARKK